MQNVNPKALFVIFLFIVCTTFIAAQKFNYYNATQTKPDEYLTNQGQMPTNDLITKGSPSMYEHDSGQHLVKVHTNSEPIMQTAINKTTDVNMNMKNDFRSLWGYYNIVISVLLFTCLILIGFVCVLLTRNKKDLKKNSILMYLLLNKYDTMYSSNQDQPSGDINHG